MDYLKQLILRYPELTIIEREIYKAYKLLYNSFSSNGKLLVAGNGGSASDADHIVGELMKSFKKRRILPASFLSKLADIDSEMVSYFSDYVRGALPAISLCGQTALITACVNDVEKDVMFAQQVYGYGKSEDIFLGITTSGNSKDIIYAMIVARAKGMKTIALTGGKGGDVLRFSDVAVIVPEDETYKIQEMHLPIYHALCLMLEEEYFL
jgi:D-sedoheptulose 7-phosphate isomerase